LIPSATSTVPSAIGSTSSAVIVRSAQMPRRIAYATVSARTTVTIVFGTASDAVTAMVRSCQGSPKNAR